MFVSRSLKITSVIVLILVISCIFFALRFDTTSLHLPNKLPIFNPWFYESSPPINNYTNKSKSLITTGEVIHDSWTCGPYVGYLVDDMRFQKDWPYNPTSRQTSSTLHVIYDRILHVGAKLYGFIIPPSTGNYDFIIVRNANTAISGEFWLSSDSNPNTLVKISELTYALEKRPAFNSNTTLPVTINYLRKNSLYYFEFHIKGYSGKIDIDVMWRPPKHKQFQTIPASNLAMRNNTSLTESTSDIFLDYNLMSSDLPSLSFQYKGYKPHVTYNVLNVTDLLIFPECTFSASYAQKRRIKPYTGWNMPNESSIYPYDENTYLSDRGSKKIERKTVKKIITLYKTAFQAQKNYSGKVLGLHYLEETPNGKLGSRFLLEMDVQLDGQNETIHTSEYVYLPKDSNKLCHTSNFQWRRDVIVYMVIAVKNLHGWVRHLIQNLEDICKQTNEQLFELVIVDYKSTDMDIEAELANSSLPRYKVISLDGKFSRAGGLQAGVDYVKDPNSIVMTNDMHLTMPPNFIDAIRKHTIQNKMVYTPIFYRLSGGFTERNVIKKGFWEHRTYGPFGMYKSDWTKVGGFSVKKYTTKWGGEDWDLIDKTLAKGYEAFRCRPPGYFHYEHSKVGMWSSRSDKFYC